MIPEPNAEKNPQPPVSPAKPATPQQKKLATELVKGDCSQAEAMRRAGYADTTALHYAKETVNHPAVQKEVAKILEKSGVTDELVGQRLKEALDYEKVQRLTVSQGKGEASIVEQYTDIDNANRLKAVELAAKLKGWISGDEQRRDILIVVIKQLIPQFAPFIAVDKRGEFMAMLETLAAENH